MHNFDKLIQAMATETFLGHLFELIDQELPINYLILDCFDIHLRPTPLGRHSNKDIRALDAVRENYKDQHLFSVDPLVQRVRDLHKITPQEFSLPAEIMVDESFNSRLREVLTVKFGIEQRIIILFKFRHRWLALKWLRCDVENQLQRKDVVRFLERNPSLLHVVGWHAFHVSKATRTRYHESFYRYEGLLQNLGAGLSTREIEVCARALTGLSGNEIAESLGIAPGTVRTLRDRAFRKLEIGKLQELSTMCLNLVDAAF